PRRCPSTRGSPRADAQRPFPSMMMATCLGAANSLAWTLVSASALDIHGTSQCEDLLFLGRDQLVDLCDHLVASLLHLLRRALAFVFADLMILFQLLEDIKAIAPDVPDGNLRGLGIFMRDLHQILAALLVELRNPQAKHLPFRRRRQPEVGCRD